MAERLEDGEFWLPQFLTDEDVVVSKNTRGNSKCDKYGFGLDSATATDSFPSGFHGSSPSESVMGSSETESEEEDYLAGLARSIANSTIGDGFGSEKAKARAASGSPQSTLCSMGNEYGSEGSSDGGSPNGRSERKSPPRTFNVLSSAAGVVVDLQMTTSNPDFLLKQKLNAVQHLRHQHGAVVWGGQAKAIGGYQIQAHPKVENRVRNVEFVHSKNYRPLQTAPAVWPPLQEPQNQQQPNNGMRAIFIGTPRGKGGCAGTGVFLPRQMGTKSETRKKPGCSTVLVPAKVMQALNLNVDKVCGRPQLDPRFTGKFNPVADASSSRRKSNNVISNQNRYLRPQPAMSHEIRLPQEWTY